MSERSHREGRWCHVVRISFATRLDAHDRGDRCIDEPRVAIHKNMDDTMLYIPVTLLMVVGMNTVKIDHHVDMEATTRACNSGRLAQRSCQPGTVPGPGAGLVPDWCRYRCQYDARTRLCNQRNEAML